LKDADREREDELLELERPLLLLFMKESTGFDFQGSLFS